MSLKILVVDDSVTFRSAIKAALANEADWEVSATAANGKIAISKLENDSFDLMILDLEMPDLDGLETLKILHEKGISIPTLIFASPTEENYKKVAMALRIGAEDFLAKPSGSAISGSIDAAVESIRSEIIPRLRSMGRKLVQSPLPVSKPMETQPPPLTGIKKDITHFMPGAIVVASSTGGPMALEKFFSRFDQGTRIPIFLVQHMPPPFTKGLAKQIEDLTGVICLEGEDGEIVRSNRIYVAPADYHMTVRSNDGTHRISIQQGPRVNFVRPAADPLFQSCAEIYRGNLMAFVLTGMGEDGKVGSIAVKHRGGSVMIQDEVSSVVWGMPGAVYHAGAFDTMGNLDECSQVLRRMVNQLGGG